MVLRDSRILESELSQVKVGRTIVIPDGCSKKARPEKDDWAATKRVFAFQNEFARRGKAETEALFQNQGLKSELESVKGENKQLTTVKIPNLEHELSVEKARPVVIKKVWSPLMFWAGFGAALSLVFFVYLFVRKKIILAWREIKVVYAGKLKVFSLVDDYYRCEDHPEVVLSKEMLKAHLRFEHTHEAVREIRAA